MKYNLGVLNLASDTHKPQYIYKFRCAGCTGLLEVSEASARLLEIGGIGICTACADLLCGLLDNKPLPDAIPEQHKRNLCAVYAKLLETLEEIKNAKIKVPIVSWPT